MPLVPRPMIRRVPKGEKVEVVFENPNISFGDLGISGKLVPESPLPGQRQKFHLTIKVLMLKK